ncbi:MAG: 50S ribosomal protein L6 [Brevinema sp.]
MSRLANKSLPIPSGVTVTVENGIFSVKGSLGEIKQDFDAARVKISVDNNAVVVGRVNDERESRALQGLYWSLVRNALTGVSEGFTRGLEIQGVGYRWEVKESKINLTVGFSHPVSFVIPSGVTVEQPSPAQLLVKGFDKQLVGQVAANIRFIKPPEPYKGKGIRYSGEVVRLKEGKSGGKKK